jgi:hypothetical protein
MGQPLPAGFPTEEVGLMSHPHLEALNARHAQIEGMIAAEMNRPRPDTGRINQWKRQKLKLKEEITRQP